MSVQAPAAPIVKPPEATVSRSILEGIFPPDLGADNANEIAIQNLNRLKSKSTPPSAPPLADALKAPEPAQKPEVKAPEPKPEVKQAEPVQEVAKEPEPSNLSDELPDIGFHDDLLKALETKPAEAKVEPKAKATATEEVLSGKEPPLESTETITEETLPKTAKEMQSAIIKMSKTLLRLAPNAESMVMDRLAYKFATAAENAYLNGDGIDKPLGVFTASPFGIATARDVSTDNTATAITADGLINAKYSLKPQYKSLNWIFHRDAIKMVRELKDSHGQYIWQPSLVAADPDRILDIPFVMSEYAPNTFTTGNYVGILGDFSYYWIADALDMAVQVLTELYAEKNQNGYIGRLESDGMPVMSEAFARVKLG